MKEERKKGKNEAETAACCYFTKTFALKHDTTSHPSDKLTNANRAVK